MNDKKEAKRSPLRGRFFFTKRWKNDMLIVESCGKSGDKKLFFIGDI